MSRTVGPPASSPMRAIQASCDAPFTDGSHACSTVLRSPAIATSARTFLCSSDGSMSMWIFFACGAYERQLAGDAIVEAHAEGQQQVGFLDRFVDPVLAVHAHHAEVERVMGRQAADAEQRHRDRNVGQLGERAALRPSRRS